MIFCVEDEANIRELVVYSLETSGFEARGFEEGTSFFEALAEELPESLNVTVRKPETVSETDSAEKSLDYAVIQKLLEAEFARRMQEKVREKLETKKAEWNEYQSAVANVLAMGV